MKYIVYLTSGEYSAYSLNDVYAGDEDPVPVLDLLVSEQSGGRWPTWAAMDGDCSVSKAVEDLAGQIRGKAVAALEFAGFVRVEATEVWLG